MSLLQMSMSGAIFILFVVVIRSLTLNYVPKRTFNILWAVAAFRLLIPFSFPSLFSIYTPVLHQVTVWQMTSASSTDAENDAQLLANPFVENTDRSSGLFSSNTVIWIAGIILLALLFALLYVRSRRMFAESIPCEIPKCNEWLQKQQLRRRVLIRVSDQISSPVTYGIIHPVILLPKNIDHENSCVIESILTHESIHIKRYDGISKFILSVTLCVHWFNPLVWVMFILANRDIELSCDEKVIHICGHENKAQYALALIDLKEKQNNALMLYNSFSRSATKERISSIMKYKKHSFFSFVGAALILCVAVCCFMTSAKAMGEETPASMREEVRQAYNFDNRKDIRVDGLKLSAEEVSCIQGISTQHMELNGGMAIYSDKGNPWGLSASQSATLTLNVSDNSNQAEKWKIMIGYIKDGKISVCLTQHITCGSTVLLVDVPHDGNYNFFIANLSSDVIVVDSCSVIVQ